MFQGSAITYIVIGGWSEKEVGMKGLCYIFKNVSWRALREEYKRKGSSIFK
jgi:hypothetical protein